LLRDSLTRALARRHWLAWCLIFGLGVALCLLLYSGDGLGRDPNYFVAYRSIYRSATYDLLPEVGASVVASAWP